MGMWSKRGALACLVVGLAACAPTMEPYTPTSKSVDQDPDKLYAAAVRVFLRRGWGFQSRDPQARAVETGWFPYAQLRIAAKPKFRASFRVIISRGLIEVFTSCGIMTGATVATGEDRCGSERPIGINVREQELVADILQEVQRQGLSDAPVGYATAPVGFRSRVCTSSSRRVRSASSPRLCAGSSRRRSPPGCSRRWQVRDEQRVHRRPRLHRAPLPAAARSGPASGHRRPSRGAREVRDEQRVHRRARVHRAPLRRAGHPTMRS